MKRWQASTLAEALELQRYGSLYLIGGGGKTTLMIRMAAELGAGGERVVVTTSTRILESEGERGGRIVFCRRIADLPGLLDPAWSRVTVARERLAPEESSGQSAREPPGAKLVGFPLEELDLLQASRLFSYMIVEADGSAGRSLKAHMEHEPVVSASASIILAVVGIDCVDRALDESVVHRSALYSSRFGKTLGEPISVDDVARAIQGPAGYLSKMPPSPKAVVAITKVLGSRAQETAKRLAEKLLDGHGQREVASVLIVGRRDGAIEVLC